MTTKSEDLAAEVQKIGWYHRTWAVAALVLFASFLVYALSPVVTSDDSRWALATAVSLERHGDIDLTEYAPTIARAHGYGVQIVDGRPYDFFPYGTAVLVTPLVAVADPILQVAGINLERDLRDRKSSGLLVEHALAAFIAAATVMLVFLVGAELLSLFGAMLLAAGYALGTSSWSIASRALWSVGPAALFLAIALLIALKARTWPRVLPWMGTALIAAYVMRPTTLPAVLALGVYTAITHRNRLAALVGCGALLAVPFIVVNLNVYHSVLPPYFRAGRIGIHSAFGEALLGNLVSPSRGLLVFSPLLVGSVVGLVVAIRRRQFTGLSAAVVAAIVVHWVAVSGFPQWWGGASYGPRLMFDMMPLWAFLAIPTLRALSEPWTNILRRQVALVALSVCMAVSVAIHARGAVDISVYKWSISPTDIDRDPGRVWDWRDPMFVRGL